MASGLASPAARARARRGARAPSAPSRRRRDLRRRLPRPPPACPPACPSAYPPVRRPPAARLPAVCPPSAARRVVIGHRPRVPAAFPPPPISWLEGVERPGQKTPAADGGDLPRVDRQTGCRCLHDLHGAGRLMRPHEPGPTAHKPKAPGAGGSPRFSKKRGRAGPVLCPVHLKLRLSLIWSQAQTTSCSCSSWLRSPPFISGCSTLISFL